MLKRKPLALLFLLLPLTALGDESRSSGSSSRVNDLTLECVDNNMTVRIDRRTISTTYDEHLACESEIDFAAIACEETAVGGLVCVCAPSGSLDCLLLEAACAFAGGDGGGDQCHLPPEP